ncbi:PIG-L family deacetylase [Ruminococcus sp. AF21-3]|nr:PIG-L family deacetylase [Ruminococcus sp. AF21-3]
MDVIIKSTDRILVIAPHADDESIGCGGMLSLYGPQCDILLLTDGRKGHTTIQYQNEEDLIRVRKEEFINAGKIAHVNDIMLLNIMDGEVANNKTIIFETVNIRNYDYVFVPNRYESHLDHKAVYPIFKRFKAETEF